jgi:hypothetical protein
MVPTRRNPITKRNINTDGVTRRWDLSLAPSLSAFEIDKVPNWQRSLTKISNLPPLTYFLKGFPVKQASIAKQFVEFLIGIALHCR